MVKEIISERYWVNQLEGELANVNIGLIQSNNDSKEKGIFKIAISDELIKNVAKLSNNSDLGRYCYFVSALNILLHKYSGEKDIILAVPAINFQQNPNVENVCFLRNVLDPDKTIKDILTSHRSVVLGCIKHQEYDYLKLGDKLKAQNPHFDFDSLFNISYIDESIQSKNSAIQKCGLIITLSSDDFSNYLLFEFDNSFNLDFIKQFARHFQRILSLLIPCINKTVNELELLDSLEKEELLLNFNTTSKARDFKSLQALFERNVESNPDQQAIFFLEKSITYKDLNLKVNQLSNYLIQNYQLKANDIVGVCLTSSIELVIAILSVLKAQGSVLPIVPSDPKDRVKHILNDSGAKLLITEEKAFALEDIFSCEKIFIDRQQEQISSFDSSNPLQAVNPQQTAYVIYTSGSTGKPKGVCLTHKNLFNLFSWFKTYFCFQSNDVFPQKTTISFVDSILELLFPVTLGNSSVYLRPYDAIGQDFKELKNWLEDIKTTIVQFVPSVFDHLIEAENIADLSNLRCLILSGEAIKKQYDLPVNIYNLYGSSECAAASTIHQIKSSFNEIASIGKPIDNTSAYILNHNLEPVPKGVRGEIFIGGEGVGLGYLNNEELTLEKFINNPYGEGLLYKTGDIGALSFEGNVQYLGRNDQQVKINGIRIELGEIERNLVLYPGIREAIVLVKHKESVKELNAYLIKSESPQSTSGSSKGSYNVKKEDLMEFLSSKLPHFMIPSNYLFFDAFPITSSSKIDRKALLDIELNKEIDYSPPRNKIEERLVSIWNEILNAKQIGIRNNFTELGGQSLSATRIISRIRKELNVEIKLRDIFLYPTIEELAKHISDSSALNFERIPVVPKSDFYDVSHSQKRMWIMDQAGINPAAYNLSYSYLLEGDLDLHSFDKSFINLLERHESLRTTFITIDGEVKQKINELKTFPFKVEHVYFDDATKDEKIKEVINAESIKPFSLSEGPLIRVKLLHMSDRRYVLVLGLHHIISDDWSTNIFFKDLFTIYNTLSQGLENSIVPLAIQYKDYSTWHNNKIKSELTAHKYWKSKLDGVIPILNLPYDYRRTGVKTYDGKHYRCILDKQLSERLREFNKNYKVTFFANVVALIKVLLYKYSGQEDIIIGSPVSGRSHENIEEQIGLFLNNLVLRDTIEANEPYLKFLTKVKSTVLEAFEHMEYPYDMLIDDLNLITPEDRNPFYDVMIVTGASEAFQNESLPELNNALKVQRLGHEATISKLDLTFFFQDVDEISIDIEYKSELFQLKTIEKMGRDFKKLTESMLDNPNITIEELQYTFANINETIEHTSYHEMVLEKLDEDF